MPPGHLVRCSRLVPLEGDPEKDPEDILERLFLWAVKALGFAQRLDRGLGLSAEAVAPVIRPQISRRKQIDGWILSFLYVK